MDVHTAKSIIFHETENPDGFLFRFTVAGNFSPENWERLQSAIHDYAESISDEDEVLDRRTAGDLHYLTQVMTIACEAIQAAGEVNTPLEAASSALWEYGHKIFSVPANRAKRARKS
jgi:hypothetical protein